MFDEIIVWIDIDEHPDLIFEVDLDILPVVLIQSTEGIHFLGPVRAKNEVLTLLVTDNSMAIDYDDPGIYDYLVGK